MHKLLIAAALLSLTSVVIASDAGLIIKLILDSHTHADHASASRALDRRIAEER